MDNFDDSKLSNQNLNEPIPLDKDPDKPIPFDDTGASGTGVSHAPLDLGGSSTARTPTIEVPKLAAKKPTAKVASTDRITGVKTFFTKLHPGAMNFLDEQIADWLRENPDVTIKRTNVATGEVQAKKTEPNILITVWY
ncbi:MAG: hypothetical protein AMJ75_05300 [Phycisphaerae bacterium SM1_79]|nr:MAG: hypothetical protein AMJ75_05300 [Phycisphaerae bacterium SM1_79]